MQLASNRLRAVLAAALFAALAAPAFAQQTDIGKLAADLAKQIDKSAVAKAPKGKAAVIVFAHSDRTVSQLGLVLADQLAKVLAREGRSFEILDPEELEAVRQQELWSESEMQEEGTACAVAQIAGAEIVILGKLQKAKDWVDGAQIEMRAVLASDAKRRTVAVVRGRIALPQEWQLLDSQPSANAGKDPGTPKAPLPEGVFRPGKDGVSFPECEYCPDPIFSDEARNAKYSATVLLQLTVSANGSVTDIAVVRAARFKLTQSAIETVKTWRFSPLKIAKASQFPSRS